MNIFHNNFRFLVAAVVFIGSVGIMHGAFKPFITTVSDVDNEFKKNKGAVVASLLATVYRGKKDHAMRSLIRASGNIYDMSFENPAESSVINSVTAIGLGLATGVVDYGIEKVEDYIELEDKIKSVEKACDTKISSYLTPFVGASLRFVTHPQTIIYALIWAYGKAPLLNGKASSLKGNKQ